MMPVAPCGAAGIAASAAAIQRAVADRVSALPKTWSNDVDVRNKLIRLGTGAHVGLYRATDGRVGASMNGARVLLLTTRGRTSGKARTTPLMRVEHDGVVHVIASAAGADTDPTWFANLVAEPKVGVQDGDQRFLARAAVLEGSERDQVYAAAMDAMDDFAEYQRRTDRVIPVVRLEPLETWDR